jgi:hypothetical protein
VGIKAGPLVIRVVENERGGLGVCPNAVAEEPINVSNTLQVTRFLLRKGFSHPGALALSASRTTARNDPSISTTRAASNDCNVESPSVQRSRISGLSA